MTVDNDESSQPARRRGMRTGYTTGACATAATKAAAQALVSQSVVNEVTIRLPIGRDATFTISSCSVRPAICHCTVIKDAGDDPDVTDKAAISAEVRWQDSPGISLRGGEGVGIVTRPGLGLEVGGPAINPVPRQMIIEAASQVIGESLNRRGLIVEISVANGAEIAKKTLNGRLGILGGISILGTTGIVEPWSTAAWRASVEQAIDVAAANGQRHLVLTTGGRSEKFAMKVVPLTEIAFVEMGIFTGRALSRCVERGCQQVTLAGMIGKFAKLAQGHFQTHVAGNQVDVVFLSSLAAQAGAGNDLESAIQRANTARHVQEIVLEAGLKPFFDVLTGVVAERSFKYVGGKLDVQAILFDFDGHVLSRTWRRG